MFWSPSSRTALAEAELEYNDQHKSLSAFVKFKLTKLPPILQHMHNTRVYALIWTTTPWTLPANGAIAVHKDLSYTVFALAKTKDCVIVASERLYEVLDVAGLKLGSDAWTVVERVPGRDLLPGATYTSVLQEGSDRSLIHGDFVTASSGTGMVHVAPGHGMDDFNVCNTLGIPNHAPVDDSGCFTEAAFPERPQRLQGIPVLDGGSQSVIDILKQKGQDQGEKFVWATQIYEHKYPIDWRTKSPVIIRATSQWFADVDSIKAASLEALENVDFIPAAAKQRLESFIKSRNHWCISRQRAWGVPIPALFKRSGGDEAILTKESIEHIISVIKDRGSDAWFVDPEDDNAWIHPKLLGQGEFVRGRDTMDVWFDSGTTWTSLPSAFGSAAPADVYLEGTDQHRGWFQSSLLTHTVHQMNNGEKPQRVHAPFKTLITHGFVLDHEGRKMSKSLGNVIQPEQIVDGTLLPPLKSKRQPRNVEEQAVNQATKQQPQHDALGVDALRLWVASSDYTRDVVIGQAILQAVNGTVHKLRITMKWLLGVLGDYPMVTKLEAKGNLEENVPLSPHPDDLPLSEQIALHQLSEISHTVHAAYSKFGPYKAVTALTSYVNDELSSSFMDIAKDALYAGTRDERRLSQYVCSRILAELLNMLAPVVPLLVEEVLEHASPDLSCHLKGEGLFSVDDVWSPYIFPAKKRPNAGNERAAENAVDTQLLFKVNVLKGIRSLVSSGQESARTAKLMGSSLECGVEVGLPLLEKSMEKKAATNSRESVIEDSLQQLEWLVDLARGEDNELARHLVVSNASVVDLKEGASRDTLAELPLRIEVPSKPGGGKPTLVRGFVRIQKSKHTKCARCWRYAVEEADGIATGQICGRCVRAMDEGQQGQS